MEILLSVLLLFLISHQSIRKGDWCLNVSGTECCEVLDIQMTFRAVLDLYSQKVTRKHLNYMLLKGIFGQNSQEWTGQLFAWLCIWLWHLTLHDLYLHDHIKKCCLLSIGCWHIQIPGWWRPGYQFGGHTKSTRYYKMQNISKGPISTSRLWCE